MNWINDIISHYNEITRMNPLVATIAIPVIGGLLYYLKSLPGIIWNWFLRMTTVTMNLNNTGWDGNIDAYNTFDKWFMESGYKRFSRNFFMFRQYKRESDANESYKPYRVGVGKGIHFFFYAGRFFWFRKGDLDSSGSERQKEEIVIRTLGWNSSAFESLVDLFNINRAGANVVQIHTFNTSDRSWTEVGVLPHKNIYAFCMNKEQKADIIDKMERFISRRDWYRSKGLTYKTSFMFHGPAGTGKTSLAKLLASHFKRDIYVLDLSMMSNRMLDTAISTVKPGSFLLMEDIDQAGNAVRNREQKKEGSSVDDLMTELGSMGGLTMSGMLNAFDGVVSLDNLIVVMTTNHIEDIDPAVRRKSRIDNEYLIDNLTPVEVCDYIQLMYELDETSAKDLVEPLVSNEWSMPGCEVENAYKDYSEDPNGFVEELLKRFKVLPKNKLKPFLQEVKKTSVSNSN